MLKGNSIFASKIYEFNMKEDNLFLLFINILFKDMLSKGCFNINLKDSPTFNGIFIL